MGRKQSEETKQKISLTLKGKMPKNINQFIKCGEKTRFSKLIITRSKKYFRPRMKINGRNYFISQIVWMQSNNFHRIPNGTGVHHIDCDPENNEPSNLILLTENYYIAGHHKISELFKCQVQKQ